MSTTIAAHIKVVGHIGDRDPMNDGGYIVDHGDGAPQLVWFERVDDGEPFYQRYTCDLLDINDSVNGPGNPWVDVAGVAECCDVPEYELRRLAQSDSWQERALALWTVAGFHGWDEFDNYPETLTEDEAQLDVDRWDEREANPVATLAQVNA